MRLRRRAKTGKSVLKYTVYWKLLLVSVSRHTDAFIQPFSFLNLLHVSLNKFFTDDSFVIWLNINLEKILFYVLF